MQVTRITEAPTYEAPGHFDMTCQRLQGREASETEAMWVGLSRIQPGGHTTLKASPQEKIYVVIEGQVTVQTDTEEATLGPLDTVVIFRGEPRALFNRTNQPATVLLLMEGQ